MNLISSIRKALAITGLALMPAALFAQVQGYVDLHSHLMAEHAYGGSFLWGSASGDEETAVHRCDGNFRQPGWPAPPVPYDIGNGSHGATKYPVVSELINSEGYNPFDSDTGWHLRKRNGYDTRKCVKVWGFIKVPGTCPKKNYTGWPRWNSIAHQQMWHGWLKQSRDQGLKLMMVSFAESNFLCNSTPANRRRYRSCDEMESVRRQAAAVWDFAAKYSDWVGIAETPSQARALIARGKLALVLSVEVTKLFPEGDFIAQLDELRSMGIRSVQLAHHTDNRFTGAAPINKLIQVANLVEQLEGDVTKINDFTCRDVNGNEGACDGINYLNELGLKDDGRQLVSAMMDRGMLMDVAHLSRKAFSETYEIAMQRSKPYPLVYSHVHTFDTISSSEERHEKFLLDKEIRQIVETGGMIGLRTGPEKTNQYIDSFGAAAVANTCEGSTRSFAQSLMYSIDRGLNVGFGADLNGFTSQLKPISHCASDKPERNVFHEKGFSDAAMFPYLMQDLQRVGVPQRYSDHLNNSAEIFLQIWERSQSLATVPGIGDKPVAVCKINVLSERPGSAELELDGSASYDPDGSIVSHSWKTYRDDLYLGQGDRVNVSESTSTVGGEYRQYKLEVTDNRGDQHTTSCGVWVQGLGLECIVDEWGQNICP